MSTTLYRKYRPSTFKEVIGQDQVTTAVQNQIIGDTIAHAYLFAGPRGLGKTTTARLIAKAINCTKRKANSSEPCNTCDSCVAIAQNQSLDFIEIDAASNRGVNEIRQLKEHIGFTPSASAYRVFIIDEVHMLTTEAFNALLKTLEEPPKHALFILATTELHKVLDTIISRCQTFRFNRVPEDVLVKRLQFIAKKESVSVAKDVLQSIAHQSGGFIRDAESLLGQVLSLGEKEITSEHASLVLSLSQAQQINALLGELADKNAPAALGIINDAVAEQVDIEYIAKELLETLRQIILIKHGAIEGTSEISVLAEQFEVSEVIQLIHLTTAALKQITYSEIPQLPLELVVIEYCNSSGKDDAPAENMQPANISKQEVSKKETKTLTSSAQPSKTSQKVKRVAKSINLTLDTVRDKWNEVITAGRKHNHSLSLALKMAHPRTITDEGVELGCAYAFHRERLNDAKNQSIIQNIFNDVFGCSVNVHTRALTKDEQEELDKQSSGANEKIVEEVLNAFGGQLVSD